MAKKSVKEIFDENHARIVEGILGKLGEDMSWDKPWSIDISRYINNRNKSDEPYSGRNQMNLMFIAWMNGWTDTRWFTFKEVGKRGWSVRKGEKSSIIEHYGQRWAILDGSGSVVKMGWFEPDPDDVPEGCRVKRWMAPHKFTCVFNAHQIDGIELLSEQEPVNEKVKIPVIDGLIASSPVTIKETRGDEAYCSFSGKKPVGIVVPHRTQFGTVDEFASTVAHEMTHSTSYDLKRDIGKKHTVAYAKEELVAEFGAMFVCADLGIDFTHKVEREENSAAYIKGWLKKSGKGDVYETIYKAASDAQRASSLIIKRYEKKSA